MSYYPNNNYYQSYPYQNQQVQPIVSSLQGKIVDSIDMVRVNEVPFGSFGIFPKGDFSEVYIKSWNSNGTTQINTYRPVQTEEPQETKENELIKKINDLNEKIDKMMIGFNASLANGVTALPQEVQQQAVEKDVKVNAY